MDPQKFCYALTSILRPCLAEYYIMEAKEVRQISTWNAEKFIICSGQEMHLSKLSNLAMTVFFFVSNCLFLYNKTASCEAVFEFNDYISVSLACVPVRL